MCMSENSCAFILQQDFPMLGYDNENWITQGFTLDKDIANEWKQSKPTFRRYYILKEISEIQN